VLKSKPVGYWRLQEMNGPTARDALGQAPGRYEDQIAFYLAGPDRPGVSGGPASVRAAHFAGGRMTAALPALGSAYSVELWLWNGLPTDFRDVTGWVFFRGRPDGPLVRGDALAIGGKAAHRGRLLFTTGGQPAPLLVGRTVLDLRTWHHVLLVRDGGRVTVYLDGERTPELAGEAETAPAHPEDRLFIGGRSDGAANFEGKLCEVAFYNRALRADEAHTHWQAANSAPPNSATAPDTRNPQ
jgi:hypothetical protein